MNYNFVSQVKNSNLLEISGVESLGVGEALHLFFEEFFTGTDRKLAQFQTSLHTINWQGTEKLLKDRNINFINNANQRITVPTYFQAGEGEMLYYVSNIVSAITVVEGFKTEIQRFYDWMKNVIKKGRADKAYQWTITNYDSKVGEVVAFIKELREGPKTATMNKVYVNFPEAFGLMSRYSLAVEAIKARDAEVMARDLKNVYEVGNLLVAKIKANDLVIDAYTLKGIQDKVSQFNELTNVVGGALGLINELTAVFNSQLKEFQAFK